MGGHGLRDGLRQPRQRRAPAPGRPGWKPRQAHTLKPANEFNYSATGLTWLPVPGVREAAGLWSKDSSYRIVGIAVAESVLHPVVTHLNQIARVAVPAFGL